jgi:hypothetical protein
MTATVLGRLARQVKEMRTYQCLLVSVYQNVGNVESGVS